MQNIEKKEKDKKCPYCKSSHTLKTGIIDHGNTIGTYYRCGRCKITFGMLTMKNEIDGRKIINASEMELIRDFEHP